MGKYAMPLHDELSEAFSLAGKVAVVTAAGSGIGQEIARVLALAGATVIATDIQNDGLVKTQALITGAGGQSIIRTLDVSVRKDVEAMADFAISQTGRLDIWVNGAGISSIHPILDTVQETAERTVAVNAMGAYWGCMAAGRVMETRGGGAIINISSAGGAKPLPNLAIYGMTKASVNSLTWTAATEFGPKGIRVNAIAPGWIETPAMGALFQDENGNFSQAKQRDMETHIIASSPLKRLGTVTDIAYALLYLASDAASFVTGQVLRVNGGESM